MRYAAVSDSSMIVLMIIYFLCVNMVANFTLKYGNKNFKMFYILI